jgi:hypothetical protein
MRREEGNKELYRGETWEALSWPGDKGLVGSAYL